MIARGLAKRKWANYPGPDAPRDLVSRDSRMNPSPRKGSSSNGTGEKSFHMWHSLS